MYRTKNKSKRSKCICQRSASVRHFFLNFKTCIWRECFKGRKRNGERKGEGHFRIKQSLLVRMKFENETSPLALSDILKTELILNNISFGVSPVESNINFFGSSAIY